MLVPDRAQGPLCHINRYKYYNSHLVGRDPACNFNIFHFEGKSQSLRFYGALWPKGWTTCSIAKMLFNTLALYHVVSFGHHDNYFSNNDFVLISYHFWPHGVLSMSICSAESNDLAFKHMYFNTKVPSIGRDI